MNDQIERISSRTGRTWRSGRRDSGRSFDQMGIVIGEEPFSEKSFILDG